MYRKMSALCCLYPNSANWRPNKESISYKNKLKNYSKKMNINFIDGEAVIDPYSLDDYSPNTLIKKRLQEICRIFSKLP